MPITPLALDDVQSLLVGTGSIDYITPSDAVFFVNVNRPTRNLAARDELIQSTLNVTITELNDAAGAHASLTARLDDITDTISGIDSTLTIVTSEFETIADTIRKVTPSGFYENGPSRLDASDAVKLSDMPGLWAQTAVPNRIQLGGRDGNLDRVSVVVNGYTIYLNTRGDAVGKNNQIDFPAAPATGTRQDLVFLEVWKEEISPIDGLFFAFGNTQYSSSAVVDGATPTLTPAAYTGSAYFTPSAGVYAIHAATVPNSFIQNTVHNIGVSRNGNFFQIRYRIRVEADVDVSDLSTLWNVVNSTALRPQGQLASAPVSGNEVGADGSFNLQSGGNAPRSTVDDVGVYVGGLSQGSSNPMGTISGISLDGYTYAIPICAIHRRNTGVYSLANQNGTAFENAWEVSSDTASFTLYGSNQGLMTVGSSTFKVVEFASSTRFKVRRISGTGTPAGSASWSYNGSPETGTLTVLGVDEGKYMFSHVETEHTRPDELWSDIINRRDVLDLRHKVSLDGDFDNDALYAETRDLLLAGTYRQEWEQLTDFDNDGNGSGLITSGIYGNVILETLGLGATVPDSGTNTNITRKLTNNNGTFIGFNGARTLYSDKEGTEEVTIYVEDQSDGSASRTHGSENSGMISYNSVTHAIEIDLTQHASYIANITKDPTLLSGHKPSIKWGNGAEIAGVLTRTSDYNWSFEVKQYGAIVCPVDAGAGTIGVGAVYQDNAGKNWVKYERLGNGFEVFLPEYATNAGSVLPVPSINLTLISGIGSATYFPGVSYYASTEGSPLGYDNTAHGTLAIEAIFATYKISYKAGSSCLSELPFGGEELIKGAEVFLDGTALAMSSGVRCTGYQDQSTKTVTLTGFAERRPTIDIGNPGAGYDFQHVLNPSVIHTGGQYVMFYTGQPTGGANQRIFRATSADGLHFTGHQLVLDIGVDTEFDDTHINSSQVILDGATWKMWYAANDGSGNNSVGYATSADGITWAKQGQVMANTFFGGPSTSVLPSAVVKSGATYYMYCSVLSLQAVNWWTTTLATSADGITWTSQGQVYQGSPTTTDWNYVHIAFQSVIKDGPLWKALAGGKDGQTGHDEVSEQESRHKYLISSDGKNWTIAGKWVSERHEGGFDATFIGAASGGSASLIKVDNRYEVFYSGYNGQNWRIGKMYLAMSQQGATGSNTLGAYTNTNPQVNLGFKSTDSVILHYERDAVQPEQSFGHTLDLEVKSILITNLGTSVGRTTETTFIDFMSKYAQLPTLAGYEAYTAQEMDVVSELSSLASSHIVSANGGVVELSTDMIPYKARRITATPSSTSSSNSKTSIGGNVNYPSATGLTLELQEVVYEAQGNSSAMIGSCFFIAKDVSSGAVFLGVSSMQSAASYSPAIRDILGNRLALLPLIGRPLLK